MQFRSKFVCLAGFVLAMCLFSPLAVWGQSGIPDSFQPTFTFGNGQVYKTVIQPNDGKIILAGDFQAAAGSSTVGIARISSVGVFDTGFNTGTGFTSSSGFGTVRDIVLLPNQKILVCGDFTHFNGIARNGLACLNADGSLDQQFNVLLNGGVNSLAVDGSGNIIIGGSFTQVAGVTRFHLARLQLNGSLDPNFIPSNGSDIVGVTKVAVTSSGKILAGGTYAVSSNIRLVVHQYLANGTLDPGFTPYNLGPTAGAAIEEIVPESSGKIMVGGLFTITSPVVQSCIVRLNSNGTYDSLFNPSGGADSDVTSIIPLTNGNYIVAGNFSSFGGVLRANLIRLTPTGLVDQTFGQVQLNNPFVSHAILKQTDDSIVIAGAFSRINNTARVSVARLSSNGILDTSLVDLKISTTGATLTKAAFQADGKIITGGTFDRVNGQSANSMVRLNPNGTRDITFQAFVDPPFINAIRPVSSGSFIAGDFTNVNGVSRSRLAKLAMDGSIDTSFSISSGANDTINDLVVEPAGSVIIVGAFGFFNGVPCNRIARLSSTGVVDQSFAPAGGPNGTIDHIYRQSDGKLIVTGDFTTFAGASRPKIARLESTGAVDPTFNPGVLITGKPVTAVIQRDGKIVFGGNIVSGNSPSNRFGVVRVNSDGTLDAAFNSTGAGANNVSQMALQPDGKLVIAGSFATYNGTSRPTLARLNPNGSIDLSFNAGNGCLNLSGVGISFSDLSVGQGTILVAGNFQIVSGQLRYNLARIPVKPNKTTPGAFRKSNGFVYLRNSLSEGFADVEFFYGTADDIPVVGDWDGDGMETIGIYRNGTFFLRNSNNTGFADLQFPFGAPGDFPIAGDWDGDGIDTIGVVRGNTVFLRNSNTSGDANLQFSYGTATDIFITGDWDGDGIDTIGAFRPTNGFVYLRNSNTTGFADLEFFYGVAGDIPVAGDWDGDGIDTIGIVRAGQWFLRNSNTTGFADIQFFYGVATDIPITGDWNGLP
ncbi:MAG: delta-60 repeat domain-containing protein [Blastocatellia bacterium]|nr:delta-60 repeat domain-containing protein [Blastocatellia bacterium]